MYVGETIGREAQAKASRISAKDADRTLKALLERDKEGTRALLKARQASGRKDNTKEIDPSSSKRQSDHDLSGSEEEEEDSLGPHPPRKNAYSADVIKKLGFDPTSKAGGKSKHQVAELQKKVNDLLGLFLPLTVFGVLMIPSRFFIVGSIDGFSFLKTYRAGS
jgi:minichromosome maintenance protein 10